MIIQFTLQSTTDGSFLTGQASNTTVYISKDGGAFAATTNAVSEIGRGLYKVELTAAESAFSTLVYNPVCTGAQNNLYSVDAPTDISGLSTFNPSTDTVTINSTQAETFATASALSSVADNVGAVKAKTDNLPSSPAAVGSAMTLTEATVTAVKSGLATGDNIEAALGAMEMYGDTNWMTADISGLSTFDPETNAVTLTDAYDAAKTASQLTTSDLSALATSADVTAAQDALTALLNLALSGLYHWSVTDSILTVYNSANVAIGAYTLTKDADGNITAVTPII